MYLNSSSCFGAVQNGLCFPENSPAATARVPHVIKSYPIRFLDYDMFLFYESGMQIRSVSKIVESRSTPSWSVIESTWSLNPSFRCLRRPDRSGGKDKFDPKQESMGTILLVQQYLNILHWRQLQYTRKVSRCSGIEPFKLSESWQHVIIPQMERKTEPHELFLFPHDKFDNRHQSTQWQQRSSNAPAWPSDSTKATYELSPSTTKPPGGGEHHARLTSWRIFSTMKMDRSSIGVDGLTYSLLVPVENRGSCCQAKSVPYQGSPQQENRFRSWDREGGFWVCLNPLGSWGSVLTAM